MAQRPTPLNQPFKCLKMSKIRSQTVHRNKQPANFLAFKIWSKRLRLENALDVAYGPCFPGTLRGKSLNFNPWHWNPNQNFIHKTVPRKFLMSRNRSYSVFIFGCFFVFPQVLGSPTYSTTKRAGCITFDTSKSPASHPYQTPIERRVKAQQNCVIR